MSEQFSNVDDEYEYQEFLKHLSCYFLDVIDSRLDDIDEMKVKTRLKRDLAVAYASFKDINTNAVKATKHVS